MKIRILPIHVGGTIASVDSGKGYRPGRPFTDLVSLVNPEITNELFVAKEEVPFGAYGIDSASMQISHMQQIAKKICDNYDHYDAFIVIHGTDTLAYTASMLSFMLHATQKPVIVTGSQKTLDDPDSDVADNIETTLVAASTTNCGVWVAFDQKIINASRATKIDISVDCLDAFVSNCKEEIPLAEFKANDHAINRNLTPQFNLEATEAIDVFCLTHTTKPSQLKYYLQNSDLKALIILIYGMSGHRKELLDILSEWSSKTSAVVIAKSHSPYGSTDLSKYELGINALQRGVLPSLDMTLESTFAKASQLLSRSIGRREFIRRFYSGFNGEINEEAAQQFAQKADCWPNT